MRVRALVTLSAFLVVAGGVIVVTIASFGRKTDLGSPVSTEAPQPPATPSAAPLAPGDANETQIPSSPVASPKVPPLAKPVNTPSVSPTSTQLPGTPPVSFISRETEGPFSILVESLTAPSPGATIELKVTISSLVTTPEIRLTLSTSDATLQTVAALPDVVSLVAGTPSTYRFSVRLPDHPVDARYTVAVIATKTVPGGNLASSGGTYIVVGKPTIPTYGDAVTPPSGRQPDGQ